MNRIDGLAPTHVCRTCGALWRYAVDGAGEPEGWRLKDFVPGGCCNTTTTSESVAPITGEQMRSWIRQQDEIMARQVLDETMDTYVEYYEHAEYGPPSDDVREWITDAIMGLLDDDDVQAAVHAWVRVRGRSRETP